MTAAESAALVEAAAASRSRQRGQLQHPLLPAQPAPARGGRRGRPGRRAARDRPLLPGLAAARHRLELAAPAGRGGALRAVGDIGSHWLDLMTFITGHRSPRSWPTSRRSSRRAASRPGPVETFSTERRRDRAARDGHRGRRDDPAPVRGRRPGRREPLADQCRPKNSLQYEIDGSDGLAAWDSEQPDQPLDRPSRPPERDPASATRP